MWRTKITEQLAIELPFVSAGMGLIARPPLAAAVSEAGGLGLLGTGPAPPPALRDMLADLRRRTSRPWGVNLIVEETAFGPAATEEHVEAAIEAGAAVVVFFWNFPPADWLSRLEAAGIRKWIQVGSVDAARRARDLGFDAVMIQGREAGGHNRSTSGLLTLLPRVVDEVAPLPVVAAGGIADGRGVAAALALGADAVCSGTRLVVATEAHAHDGYKQRIVDARLEDLAETRIFGPEWPDAPMRVLRNRVVRAAEEGAPLPPEPRQIGRTLLFGMEYSMPYRSAVLPTPETEGDLEEMCLAAGESAALVRRLEPAAAIVRDMMAEAAAILERAALRAEHQASADPQKRPPSILDTVDAGAGGPDAEDYAASRATRMV